VLALLTSTLHAAPLTSGNIVVAMGFTDKSTPMLAEFTPAGSLVQTYAISSVPNGTEEWVSGVTVGLNNQPYVYAGEFHPALWTVNTSTGVQSTQAPSNWSNVGNTNVGSLVAYQNYVYATSENAANSNGGVFRFNLSNNTVQQMFVPNP
jgi:hypothetical protein